MESLKKIFGSVFHSYPFTTIAKRRSMSFIHPPFAVYSPPAAQRAVAAVAFLSMSMTQRKLRTKLRVSARFTVVQLESLWTRTNLS